MINNAHAGLGDFFDYLHEKKITLRISVVDEAGKPIPYATVWEVDSYRKNPIDATGVMKRLLRRYAKDADNVTTVGLHPSMLVYYADKNGKIDLTVEAKDVEDRDAGSMLFAVAGLKRGYMPAMSSNELKLNTTVSITLRLQAIPQFIVDPALAELDEIRGAVESSNKMGMRSLERSKVLSDAGSRIRVLAMQAEHDGKLDTAATLFHYLANIPSIETFVNATGKPVGIKVTNGYDEKNEQRRSDYEKALELNRSNPQLLYVRMWRKYRNPENSVLIKNDDVQRKAFLAEAEVLRERFGESLWPFDFQMEWKQYAQLGFYQKSCEHLNEFYQFEPTYFNEKEWADEADYVAYKAKQRGDTFVCHIKKN